MKPWMKNWDGTPMDISKFSTEDGYKDLCKRLADTRKRLVDEQLAAWRRFQRGKA